MKKLLPIAITYTVAFIIGHNAKSMIDVFAGLGVIVGIWLLGIVINALK